MFADRKEINVVFLGGSITQGAGVVDKSKCFANMTGEWLKNRFGAEKLNYYNEGIGGTPSFYGLLRFNRDVAAHNPDMVFIEFAVNDNGTDSRIYIEGLVRSLLKLPKKPYVVFLYTTSHDYTTSTENFEQVAQYYGIPQISLKDALKNELSGKDALQEGYLADGVHPAEKGYFVYYKEMVRCLENSEYYKQPLEKERMFEGTFCADTTFTPATNFAHDGWVEVEKYGRTGIFSEKEGQVFEFEFDGDILGFEHGIHQASGTYNVYVDGKFVGTGDSYYDCKGNEDQPVFGYRTTDLENTHHKVRIETAKGKLDGERILIYKIISGEKNKY